MGVSPGDADPAPALPGLVLARCRTGPARHLPVVLTLAGDVDTDNVDDALADLLRQLDDEPLDDFEPVEIDCSRLTYLGSAGMSMLVRFRSRSGREIVLLGLADAFRRIFVVSGLDRMFVIR